ncbi:hypothetical protein Achl_2266 [Pseudarthrobacter chlorophenolicus A6]|uniref:Uncharacterized protein n=1 Tax=Pseudarthrobacter chlorophenolicus (strain ATCC 700700 / DSM 12829 / CIP 107037 / JCM 12360 / KCTC 9906 / NCIMB 13794 / A6) TaxID=452863 RepID=B8HAD9_PSECP|nr:hypothetical protein [Pseudarthrobacter chlorophenolicus]ACL40231.1 hypothetical protein Achl_2266 [Pseudarthrobacter chlorophenolicus A6]SDQ85367.1 hypothetical protein SAMN04489738_3224 [Pseudarthrobacter chlorophenolicus]
MTSAPTIAELIANAEADNHDHSSTEKSTGLLHIHNHAAGTVVWFPTWKTFRGTADWSEAVDAAGAELATLDTADTADAQAAGILAGELEELLKRAAVSGDAAAFAGENLTGHLTRSWALGDAAAKATGREPYSAGTLPAAFEGYPYEVYAQDGGVFASSLFNDIIDARRQHALAEEAARKALKPVSRKALKNAARKAARR